MTTAAKISALKKTGNLEPVTDELNPELLFRTTWSELLVQIATGKLDAKQIAINELRNRGLDPNTGLWIGFDKY